MAKKVQTKALKTWQKILLGVGGFLLVVIIALTIFLFVQWQKVDNFVNDNFGTVETAAQVEDVTIDPFIMYISGIDTRDGTMPDRARSDLNILAVVNPKTKKILMVNVPRDYYVPLHGLNAYDKLTHAGDIGGLELSKTTIEDLLGVQINYATRVNFNLLDGVVNAVGGVTVESGIANNYSLYWNHDCIIHYGANDLDGACAVAYARERKAVGGDLYRAENQEQVITAILNKISADKTILLNYGEILDALSGNFETSLSAGEVKDLIAMQLRDMSGWQTEEANLETSGQGEEYGYLYPNERHFVFYINSASVQQAHDRIMAFML